MKQFARDHEQLLRKLVDIVVYVLVYGMVASVPALIFSAFWFNDGDLLWWLAVPIIFFMAG
jgi:hypothetical protein